MRIATWNVNSIKQRIDNLTRLAAPSGSPTSSACRKPRCVDEAFPREPLEALGYNVAVHGQKTFNGVAILSKLPFDEVTPRLPGDDADDHARFIEAVVSTAGGALRVASIYLPNGNPPDTEKYPYKIKWMDRLLDYARERLAAGRAAGAGRRLQRHPDRGRRAQPGGLGRRRAVPAADPRQQFRALTNLGLTDAVRAVSDDAGPLHVLGLSGRRLAEEQRHPHRPPAAVAAGRRPARRPPASTSTCAPGRSRPTTCRCGSSWSSARRTDSSTTLPRSFLRLLAA